MKHILFVLLLLPAIAFGQKGYYHFYGGLSHSKDNDKGFGGISFGPKINKDLGLGGGISYIGFEKPYIPVTLDLTLLVKSKKVVPIGGIKAGYGLYNYTTRVGTVRGGFTGTLMAGASFPTAKIRTTVTAGVSRYSFNSTLLRRKVSSYDDRIFLAIGVLL